MGGLVGNGKFVVNNGDNVGRSGGVVTVAAEVDTVVEAEATVGVGVTRVVEVAGEAGVEVP